MHFRATDIENREIFITQKQLLFKGQDCVKSSQNSWTQKECMFMSAYQKM